MAEIWFDTRTGDQLIGQAAVAGRLEESGPGDIVPLGDLVFDRTRTIPAGEYEKADTHQMTREEYLDYGHWVVGLLSADERYGRLLKSHVERLAALGVGPGITAIRNRFGPMFEDYVTALGEQKREPPYGDWNRRRFYDYARQLAAAIGRNPTEDDYDEAARNGDGPSTWILKERANLTPGLLGEMMGYPNVYMWQEEDYVAWGARAMAANYGSKLTFSIINVLSERDRGPSRAPLIKQFGSTAEFQRRAHERYLKDPSSRRVRNEAAVDRFGELLTKHLVSKWLVTHHILAGTAMEFVAKFDVAMDCLPDIDELAAVELASVQAGPFMTRVRKLGGLDRTDIELSLIATRHTDDLLPLSKKWDRHLHVSRKQLHIERQGNLARYGFRADGSREFVA